MMLTDQQREVWLASQMNPAASSSYNWPLVLDFRGSLDLRVLTTALQIVADRHDALRTSFPSGSELRISEHISLDVPVVDLRHYPPERRDEAVKKILTEDVRVPLDLGQAPLARGQILRLEDDHHQLIITIHHIIADGWAGRILTTELGQLYKAMLDGRPAILKPAPRLADYQRRQESWTRSAEMASARAYWDNLFHDGFSPLEMPTDHRRPPQRRYDGGRIRVALAPPLAHAIRQLSVKQSCTLFMTCLAAFEAFAFRVTGQSDMVIGIPFANRDLADDENLVIHCANLLTLRSPSFSDDTRFSDLLRDVRTRLLAAYEYGAYPLARIAEDLDLPRNPRYLAHVSTVFNIEQVRSGLDFGAELEVRGTIPPSTRGATFDLVLTIVQDGQALFLDVIYNHSLYRDETIRRWASQYETLLVGASADPGRRISELPLLSEQERQLVVTDWNTTTVPYPADRSIPEQFEEVAGSRPEAIAVCCGAEQMTYGELNVFANRLGHWLREAGVGPDSAVGLCLPPSVQRIVGLLGTLKAGGAYLPMDPAFPRRRLQLMADEAEIGVIVTEAKLKDRLPAGQRTTICLDTDWPQIARCPSGNPGQRAKPDNLAYVTYTSGSTGRPKGVMVTHRNVRVHLFKKHPISGVSVMRRG
jgi:hypothetical protein